VFFSDSTVLRLWMPLPKKSIKGNCNKHYLSGLEGWLAPEPLNGQMLEEKKERA
jgi:hypothetical protein